MPPVGPAVSTWPLSYTDWARGAAVTGIQRVLGAV
jgi:hypothetical protein